MKMITNEKKNFKSIEEKTYKEVMELGRNIIKDQLRLIDQLIKKYRDKEVFKIKDSQETTVKTKLGEITFYRRRYIMEINNKKKYVYLLDELLEINCIGQYSESIVEMIIREVTKKSYRETAKTITEDTDMLITHTAVRNVILKLGEKIKKLEEEKIKLYEEGRLEGTKEIENIFCEHDGIYIKKQKSKKNKGKKKYKTKHFRKKKMKKKKNGIELKIAVVHEGKEPRYKNDYKLKNKIVVGTASRASHLKKIEDTVIGTTYKEHKIKNIVINGDGADWTGSIVEGTKEIFQLDMAHIQKRMYQAVKDEEYLKKMQEIVYTEKPEDIFSLIYNYKVELESDKKQEELEKVKELEKYLRSNEKGLKRYQYKLGYKAEEIEKLTEELPSLGSEESQMYCVCRDRMKRNRTSWNIEGAEAMLKVIMENMNGTITEILTKKAEEKIKEELAQRVPDPKRVKKSKYEEKRYSGKYEIAHNFNGGTREYILDFLREKKFNEMAIIN